MSSFSDVPFSVLDLSPINKDSAAAESFRNSLSLAQHAENLGFNRFWLAEHHNMTGIASAATSVVIGYIAAGTSKIRVGAGGIMLPNHAPIVIAEQFGTLESMFPNRIDLGLGRAPGSDRVTAHALRRTLNSDGDDF
ncbi:MAG: MsnO8 family LLM class oxidoreductase, partial [Pyrinomonadaceae bacterium]